MGVDVITPGATPPVPTPGSPEHDAAMLAKFEAAQAPAKPPADGEQLILGKFKTQDDLAKAYSELEKKLGAGKPDTPADTPATPDPTKAGKVDWQAVGQEIGESGELSGDSRRVLNDLGIPDEVIDGYVSSRQVVATEFRTALEGAAGGAEQFETIRMWAATALSDSEKGTLQKMVEGGVETAKIAIATMRSKYEAAHGSPPRSPVGGKAPGASGNGYGSTAEMTRDINNPKYRTDSAFRAQVEARLSATTAF